jgi:hypothetical protein
MFITTFNIISDILLRSVLLMEETGGPGENHRPVASQLKHNSEFTSINDFLLDSYITRCISLIKKKNEIFNIPCK